MLSARLLRSVEPRAVTLLVVVALALAPALSALWPALGKGRMLWVGEPPAGQLARDAREAAAHHRADHPDGHSVPHSADGAGHGLAHDPAAASSDRFVDERHAPSAADAPLAHAGHDDRDEFAPHHHEGHCALCVLAALGWAPPGGLVLASVEHDVAGKPDFASARAPRASLLWDRARARAPPRS